MLKSIPEQYPNEFNALIQLRHGLETLYNSVRPTEIDIINTHPDQIVSFFGNCEEVPQQLQQLLPCFFHWFGTSVCNYARLAGYIVAREKGDITEKDLKLDIKKEDKEKIKIACKNYTDTIAELEEVFKWRNKVSAHFALTDPHKEDNLATMEASIIYPVSFETNRFTTGAWILSRSDQNGNNESDIPKWSLTETFEKLADRFW